MVDGGITIDGNSQPGQEQESTAQPSPGHSQALLTTLVILESLPTPPATIPTLELSTEPRESFHSIRYTYTPKNLLRHYAE